MTRAQRTAWRESQRFTRAAVREAQAASGITGQELAAMLGITHPQLCRQLAEPDDEEDDTGGPDDLVDNDPWHEHLSVQRLMQVGADVESEHDRKRCQTFWLVMLMKIRMRFAVAENPMEKLATSMEALAGSFVHNVLDLVSVHMAEAALPDRRRRAS